MLGKLIKYDLKSMLRTMFPLWIALFIASILFGIRSAIFHPGSEAILDSSEADAIQMLMFVILFGVGVAVFVLNIIVIIQRFWHGLLKDEGYLMFTLPVSVRQLILSKAISAFILSLLSLLVALVCFLLIIAASILASLKGQVPYLWYIDVWRELKSALVQAFGRNPAAFAGWTIYWIIAGATDLLGDIYQAYAAMAIGQLSNKNRFISSIIAYIGISIVLSTIVAIPLVGLGQLGGFGFVHFFDTEAITTTVMIIGLVVNILQLIAFHIITEFILRNNLNLE
ncbi:MAG: hypothetical protein IJ137_02735 [Eubacterium sp.]|nr:hypothetical protein [Eubacterium sp.]